jgi:hypothetical protein
MAEIIELDFAKHMEDLNSVKKQLASTEKFYASQ